jgi:hypothetical protein
MSAQKIPRHTTDTRSTFDARLLQPDGMGIDQIVDLTGCTVTFKLINTATGVVVISPTAATIVDATAGRVAYDFTGGQVANPGLYAAYFVVTQSGETDHFPVGTCDMIIAFDGDSQSAEDAHAAAL